jgi:hypothetical protein
MDWRTSARSEIISWLPRCRTITMISKCIALLVAAQMVASCCALGNGCAPESRAPIARDGLGSSPASDSQPVDLQPEKRAPTKREIVVSPLDAEATEQDRTVQQGPNGSESSPLIKTTRSGSSANSSFAAPARPANPAATTRPAAFVESHFVGCRPLIVRLAWLANL